MPDIELSPSPAPSGRRGEEDQFSRALLEELRRRIAEIGSYSDGAFGRLGSGELIATAAICIALPAIVVWLFR